MPTSPDILQVLLRTHRRFFDFQQFTKEFIRAVHTCMRRPTNSYSAKNRENESDALAQDD